MPNISRSKGNQTIKFGQLEEYNMTNVFLKKNHKQNVVEKLVQDLLVKNQNLAYFWINILILYTVNFYVCPSRGLPKRIESSFTSFNPLQPGFTFLYPLKTSENLKVF